MPEENCLLLKVGQNCLFFCTLSGGSDYIKSYLVWNMIRVGRLTRKVNSYVISSALEDFGDLPRLEYSRDMGRSALVVLG